MHSGGNPFMPDLGKIELTTVEQVASAAGAKVIGDAAVQVRGAVADNRRLRGGELFVAMPGEHVHGAKFAKAAVEAGAAAVLTDREGAEIAGEIDAPVLVVSDMNQVAGPASSLAWGRPSEQLNTWGVTGTNGKTTIVYLLKAILRQLGRKPALIGTVDVEVGDMNAGARNTTPFPDELQAILASAVQSSCTDVVMEVSSHALSLGRVRPMRFDVVGFTNLTQDHLDFHHTMENYFQAKLRLFTPELSKNQVVIVDDEWGRRIVEESCGENLTTLSMGDAEADWHASYSEHAGGITLTLDGPAGHHEVPVNLPGDYNAANSALAIVMAAHLLFAEAGESAVAALFDKISGGLEVHVPGRMELISANPRVIVDFAHNPDATRKVLKTLRPTTKGRLIILLGSAGQRDQEKRPILGQIACELADKVYVTDDDPHEEDPAAIRAAVLEGTRDAKPDQVIEIADRREAIVAAITEAGPDDTVLLAGRGHETIQPMPDGPVELDDRVVAREALSL